MNFYKIEDCGCIINQDGVCGGRPTIEGTGIEPWHIANYGTIDDVLKSWNYLNRQQVEAAFDFYHNNKEYQDFIKKENEIPIDWDNAEILG
jgi:uncharacterized protein (DUF433 family)